MFRKPVFAAIVALAVVTMACGIRFNFPVEEIPSGPTRTEEISVPEPNASVAELELNFGAGELELAPGAQDVLVSGTATYNIESFKPEVSTDGEQVRIQTGSLEIKGIPDFSDDLINQWEFQLGKMPMRLKLNAGAYKGDIELGGLSLQSLEVADGAADVRLGFSEPNKTEMDTLRYQTGASNVKLSGLANANFSSMIFRSGAGDYKLDFSGKLQRDSVVTIESGISHVIVVIPEGTPAKVIFKGGLASVSTTGEWSRSGDAYVLEGEGPGLTINVDMGAGNLELLTK